MTGDSDVGRHGSARPERGILTDYDGIVLEMDWVFLLLGRHLMGAVLVRERVELEVQGRSGGQSLLVTTYASRLLFGLTNLLMHALRIPAPCILAHGRMVARSRGHTLNPSSPSSLPPGLPSTT